MEQREIICTTCPIGCKIKIALDGGKIISLSGNTCPRGKIYAENEVFCPKRTLTTTVKTDGGIMLPVKTSEAIDKALLFSCMKEINAVKVKLPITIGDEIIKNILNTKASVVACRTIKK